MYESYPLTKVTKKEAISKMIVWPIIALCIALVVWIWNSFFSDASSSTRITFQVMSGLVIAVELVWINLPFLPKDFTKFEFRQHHCNGCWHAYFGDNYHGWWLLSNGLSIILSAIYIIGLIASSVDSCGC